MLIYRPKAYGDGVRYLTACDMAILTVGIIKYRMRDKLELNKIRFGRKGNGWNYKKKSDTHFVVMVMLFYRLKVDVSICIIKKGFTLNYAPSESLLILLSGPDISNTNHPRYTIPVHYRPTVKIQLTFASLE